MKTYRVGTAAALVVATTMFYGCATSEKIQVVQPGDNRLTCPELNTELAKLEAAKNEIDSKKGVTGTNVASALFWLPGLVYTYYDAGEAEKLIRDRRSALTNMHNSKNCPK